jgi:methionyl aminopeptidase
VTTDYIDAMVHDRIVASGAFPSPLGYKGYPKSICTSVNEVMCHGIPDNRALLAGDIVNVDVTVFLDGYHGDTSATFFVGGPEQCSTIARDLVQATEEALAAGIELCAPGRQFHEIGNRIHKVVNGRFGISEIFVGHGIGSYFHGPPYIFHHANHYGRSIVGGDEMRPGMTFTIEPILTEKSPKDKLWSDGWTAVTRDGGLSAQCEHTVLITETGVEVLTARQPSAGNNTTLSSSAAQGS